MAEAVDPWIQGLQIGNTWAAQHSRNRESQDRRDMYQSELAARFGDDTVFGKDGKVDVVRSAANKRVREEVVLRSKATGTLAAWDGGPIEQPKPTAQFNTPLEPRDPGMPGSRMMPSADDFPMGPPAAVAAPMQAPAAQNRFQVPPGIESDPYALASFASQREQVAQERRLTGSEERRVMAEKLARQSAAVREFGPDAQIDPNTGEVNLLPSAQAAEKRISDRARMLAIGEQAGTLGQAGPPTAEQESSSDYQRGLTLGINRRVPVESRENIAEMNNQARADRQADKLENDTKLAQDQIKLKRELGLNKPDKMSLEDQTFTRAIVRNVVRQEDITSSLDKNIEQMSDEDIDPYVRRQAGLNILKSLNSVEGSDAVSVDEAKRLGQFLQFQINPFESVKTGRYFGIDTPRFIQQVRLKSDELKQRSAEGRATLKEISSRNNAPSASAVTQALVDSKPTVPADSVLMTNPQGNKVAVPMSRLEEARKAGYK